MRKRWGRSVEGWRLFVLVLAAGLLLGPVGARAQQAAPAAQPAPPFSGQFGGQLRVRAEGRDPAAYTATGASSLSTGLALIRTRFHLKTSLGDGFHAYVQFQDARRMGEEASVTSDEAGVDLHQAWVQVDPPDGDGWTLRLGREAYDFGSERLVSSLDWSNTGRAWDGLHLYRPAADGTLHLFSTVVKAGADAGHDRYFSGLVWQRGNRDLGRDLYLFHERDADGSAASEAGKPGDRSVITFGGRVAERAGALDYSAEVAAQTGDVVGDDLSAVAVAGGLGWRFPWRAARLGLEYARASGDQDPADGKQDGFRPPFPFGHYYHGYTDLFGWRNLQDVFLRYSCEPREGLWVAVDLHQFSLVEDRDAWYDAGGAALRRDAAGGSGHNLGTELDLHAKFKLRGRMAVWLGWSGFKPGSFVDNTGDDPSMDWWFLQASLEF